MESEWRFHPKPEGLGFHTEDSEVVAVNVGDLKERTLTVRTSKTDQEGTSESLYVDMQVAGRWKSPQMPVPSSPNAVQSPDSKT